MPAYTPGLGSLLKVSISASQTTVAQQVTFSGPRKTKAAIDTTDLSLSVKTFLPGIPDSGEVSFSGWYDPANTVHQYLETSWTNGVTESWNIVLNDAGDAVIAFSGFLTALEYGEASVDSVIPINGTIKITGAVTVTP
jgi:hypothetical protein